jgi:hypothetical protein
MLFKIFCYKNCLHLKNLWLLKFVLHSIFSGIENYQWKSISKDIKNGLQFIQRVHISNRLAHLQVQES